jgi:hypothetical protein
MKNVFLAFTVLAAALAGCSRKQANSPEDLQKAFANSTASASALNTAKPEVKIWVDQAVTAIKNDDQATAVLSLRSLRSSGQLTADQSLVVEDLMTKARGALIERAARGDQQAAMAVQMLNQNPR